MTFNYLAAFVEDKYMMIVTLYSQSLKQVQDCFHGRDPSGPNAILYNCSSIGTILCTVPILLQVRTNSTAVAFSIRKGGPKTQKGGKRAA